MKVKVSLKELEKAVNQIKIDSLDLDISIETDMNSVKLRFSDKEHKLVIIELFDTSVRSTANITKTSKL